jgi:hypothetical protein
MRTRFEGGALQVEANFSQGEGEPGGRRSASFSIGGGNRPATYGGASANGEGADRGRAENGRVMVEPVAGERPGRSASPGRPVEGGEGV